MNNCELLINASGTPGHESRDTLSTGAPLGQVHGIPGVALRATVAEHGGSDAHTISPFHLSHSPLSVPAPIWSRVPAAVGSRTGPGKESGTEVQPGFGNEHP